MMAKRTVGLLACTLLLVSFVSLGGCPFPTGPGDGDPNTTPDPNEPNDGNDPNTPDPNEPAYANTTDKSNADAQYIGSAACRACHPTIDALQSVHAHAHKLTKIEGAAPEFPAEGLNAGVPNPPDGYEWSDIAYVIGGYYKKGRFVDQDGYIITKGFNGVDSQWNLDFLPNGTSAKWVAYEGANPNRKPYDQACFVCHTTGPEPLDEDSPAYQDNRPGLAGTWKEAGIQCESCHGPGSKHVADPASRALFVDLTGANTCNECHNRPFNSLTGEIQSKNGYIDHHEQYPELLASGGHADLTCTTCHDPHASTYYAKEQGLRMQCTDCHEGQNHALHEGAVFVRGAYSESVTCVSCHMPYVTKSATNAAVETVGALGRMGDTRTHIFRINTTPVDYTAVFAADLLSVKRDDSGLAAVTVDYVCLRCHNGIGNAFDMPLDMAAGIADVMHSTGQ